MEALDIKPAGTYVDATFGGGGHSKAILSSITTGRLIAFDQDAEAGRNKIEDSRFTLITQNFRRLQQYLKFYNAIPADGILADLGVSSHQFDTAQRGFSTRFEGALDMRMSSTGKTARQILEHCTEEELQQIFSRYGEIRNAKKLAMTIVNSRRVHPLNTTHELKKLLYPLARGKNENQYYAQVFQALRIEVNDEINALKDFLKQAGNSLCKGGRVVIMSYHSLEDRIVKNYFSKGNFEGRDEKDFYGNKINVPFKALNKKPVTPGEKEVNQNPRARSAKLRAAVKL